MATIISTRPKYHQDDLNRNVKLQYRPLECRLEANTTSSTTIDDNNINNSSSNHSYHYRKKKRRDSSEHICLINELKNIYKARRQIDGVMKIFLLALVSLSLCSTFITGKLISSNWPNMTMIVMLKTMLLQLSSVVVVIVSMSS